ncbi:MAG TPA: hypothetical protein VM468_16835 [Mycoplana sp.]|nr:hypothetical protein [Mycoplana sp.]
MHTFDDVDVALFGVPAGAPAYDGLARPERWNEAGAGATAALVLDLKAEAHGDPLEQMQAMLGEMTKELRERFQQFQGQRRRAEQQAGEAEDEAGRKLAQADAKAAIEAVSLIVRTLEKIDSLQRTILSERREVQDLAGDTADFEAVVAEFDRRVEAKARAYFEQWKADHEARAERSAADPAMGVGGDGKNGP